jgi:hypothetical protein
MVGCACGWGARPRSSSRGVSRSLRLLTMRLAVVAVLRQEVRGEVGRGKGRKWVLWYASLAAEPSARPSIFVNIHTSTKFSSDRACQLLLKD